MSDQSPLFALREPLKPVDVRAPGPEEPRVVRPQRHQLRWEARDLDSALPEDHMAWAVWDLSVRLDLRRCYASIKSVTEGPGRPADPRVLLALSVYAVRTTWAARASWPDCARSTTRTAGCLAMCQ